MKPAAAVAREILFDGPGVWHGHRDVADVRREAEIIRSARLDVIRSIRRLLEAEPGAYEAAIRAAEETIELDRPLGVDMNSGGAGGS